MEKQERKRGINKAALFNTIIYVLLSIAWIEILDFILNYLTSPSLALHTKLILKSIMYVSTMSGMLYYFLFHTLKKRLDLEYSLRSTLQERESLLREIHHRVKNNLQVITSMLSLQRNNITCEEDMDIFDEMQTRVRAMSIVHEHLYRSDSLAHIDLALYLHDIAQAATDIFWQDGVTFEFKLSPIEATIDTATPLGLITMEMLTNSLRHGISHGGRISVELAYVDAPNRLVRLLIKDNGVGFPEKMEEGLGWSITNALVSQICATIERYNDHGACVSLVFKAEAITITN